MVVIFSLHIISFHFNLLTNYDLYATMTISRFISVFRRFCHEEEPDQRDAGQQAWHRTDRRQSGGTRPPAEVRQRRPVLRSRRRLDGLPLVWSREALGDASTAQHPGRLPLARGNNNSFTLRHQPAQITSGRFYLFEDCFSLLYFEVQKWQR